MLRAALVLAALAAPAFAQSSLFSNAASGNPDDPGLSTGSAASNGAPAPASGFWSELQADADGANAVAGFSSHLAGTTGAYRFADDFTVPPGAGWVVDSVSFYAYQSGAAGGLSPFASLNLRIWSGRPGNPGSTIVFGDTTTNRLSSSTLTDIFRIFRATAQPSPQPPASSRRIWRTDASLGSLVLLPGTYWIDWQYGAAVAGAEAFSPAVTLPGQRSKPGANAIQFKPDAGGQWLPALDAGKPAAADDAPQDLPFIIRGSPRCPSDFNNSGGTPDDADIAAFFFAWNNGDESADINQSGGTPDDADIAAFFQFWNNGC